LDLKFLSVGLGLRVVEERVERRKEARVGAKEIREAQSR